MAGGNGGTEQWRVGHHQRLRRSRPLIVLQKECDRARTMTGGMYRGDGELSEETSEKVEHPLTSTPPSRQ